MKECIGFLFFLLSLIVVPALANNAPPALANPTALKPAVIEAPPPSPEEVARFENRLNELMFWRLSDELGLKPGEEQKLKATIKKYQEQRKSSLANQQDALKKINEASKEAPARNCEACLVEYEKSVLSMADANTREFKELKLVLGAAKMQKFLVIRSQMTKDVVEALRQPATPPTSPAPSK